MTTVTSLVIKPQSRGTFSGHMRFLILPRKGRDVSDFG